jgi:hypothetical protein
MCPVSRLVTYSSRYSDQATRWTIRVSDPCRGKRFFSSQKFHTDSGYHPASQWMGAWVLFSIINRSEREANSCLFTAEVRNEYSYTSTLSTCLHSLDREKFVFNLSHCSETSRLYTVNTKLLHCPPFATGCIQSSQPHVRSMLAYTPWDITYTPWDITYTPWDITYTPWDIRFSQRYLSIQPSSVTRRHAIW